jgi:uncharacterized protein involved in exopolysaccharide biosynthesis
MDEHNLDLIKTTQLPSRTLRDWVTPCFRHGRLMILTFAFILSGAILVTWFMPAKYAAEVKILVKRERADPVVNPDPNNGQLAVASLTEEDLNSEVELLKSRDLLEKVVTECGLDVTGKRSLWGSVSAMIDSRARDIPAGQLRKLRAIQSLEKSLSVEPLKKTKLIVVTYESQNPELSAKVLQVLVRLYLEKHVAVHRVPGAADFFKNQTERYRQRLLEAQRKAAGFGADTGVAAASMEKEITVREISNFDADLQKTRAAMAETEQRIRTLRQLEIGTPERLTTQVRKLDSPILLQQLKSTLLNLELKRSELLSKFSPDYRLVKDVESEIAQTRQTLAKEEENPLHEETTDRDATHEWVKAELAKARAQLAGLGAQAASTRKTIEAYRTRAHELNQSEIVQQDLIRSAKLAEDNFLLYSRKQEEAQIQDALDQRRIVNVSIAEEATVPALPSGPHRSLTLALGGLLACALSLGLAYTVDYVDSTFRTPQEVELFLNTPVLASLPKN